MNRKGEKLDTFSIILYFIITKSRLQSYISVLQLILSPSPIEIELPDT